MDSKWYNHVILNEVKDLKTYPGYIVREILRVAQNDKGNKRPLPKGERATALQWRGDTALPDKAIRQLFTELQWYVYS